MYKTKLQILEKLPNRDFWFTAEIAAAFGVCKRAVQYTAKRKNIGKKFTNSGNGIYVFAPEHLDALCEHIHGEVGNPVTKSLSRKRLLEKENLKKSNRTY